MRLPIALGSYKRDAAYLPELRLRNLILEKTPSDDETIVLLARPGLAITATVTGSDVKAVWVEPGLFSGATVALAGSGVFLAGVSIGTLASAAVFGARFASSTLEMIFCNGGTLYRTDGVTVTQPTFAAGGAQSVAFLNSYFLAVRKGTNKFYWSAVNDAATWPALNFASAESHPGKLLDVITINDQFALLGQESIEFWQGNPSGDQNLPFTRIDGLTYSKGVYNTGASVYVDNTLVWVANDGIVYRRSAVPQRISDHGIEQQIKNSSAAYLFTFVWTGHTIMCMRLDTLTYAYDFETGKWTEFSTYGRIGWRAQCGCANGTTPVFGDSVGPNVLGLNDTALYDVGDTVERRFMALIPDQAIVDNIWLDAQGGIGSEPSGDPIIVEMSISRDGSQTFSDFMPAYLGKRGEYRKRAAWRRLGRYDIGAVLDFRITDPALFSVQSVRMNETLSGRGT